MESIDFSLRWDPWAYIRADLPLVTDLLAGAYMRPGLICGRLQCQICQTKSGGHHFLSTLFPENWTPIDTKECSYACAALNRTAISASNGSTVRYLCAGYLNGYRSGYKTTGVAGCHIPNSHLSPFACLCDHTSKYRRLVWKAPPSRFLELFRIFFTPEQTDVYQLPQNPLPTPLCT